MRTPYLEDVDLRLYRGDALDVLREMPSGSVQMCCTSPPFFGLRDYGMAGQIGSEPTVEEWCETLVSVFAEVRRVLRDDGVLFVEIGDSYDAGTRVDRQPRPQNKDHGYWENGEINKRIRGSGTKAKDLLGQPWLLAFALRADGWYLRSEIIWARPNPMPESVSDRPTKSHSTIFLLSKKSHYYYDMEAIREPWSSGRDDMRSKGLRTGVVYLNQDGPQDNSRKPQVETLDGSEGETPRGPDGRRATAVVGRENSEQHRDGERWPNEGRNARTVWTVPTEPTPFAHFATWPQEIVRRMILAGTSEKGCCPECGAPWVREMERGESDYARLKREQGHEWTDMDAAALECGVITRAGEGGQTRNASGTVPSLRAAKTSTVGWLPTCDCFGDGRDGTHVVGPDPVPCTVLNPFFGSGTTGLVARKHGRHTIGIELSEAYCKLAADRLKQLSLFTELT